MTRALLFALALAVLSAIPYLLVALYLDAQLTPAEREAMPASERLNPIERIPKGYERAMERGAELREEALEETVGEGAGAQQEEEQGWRGRRDWEGRRGWKQGSMKR